MERNMEFKRFYEIMKGDDFDSPVDFKSNEQGRIELIYNFFLTKEDRDNLTEENARRYRKIFREGLYLGKEIALKQTSGLLKKIE
jgi:hypothetical protein